mmetsp:Transcript_5314/g.15039  ORF Transcript_5314/g.15039 Transcript_5314/m.15039 type:complete len:598 (-) Transcript_5314:78-1871(-)
MWDRAEQGNDLESTAEVTTEHTVFTASAVLAGRQPGARQAEKRQGRSALASSTASGSSHAKRVLLATRGVHFGEPLAEGHGFDRRSADGAGTANTLLPSEDLVQKIHKISPALSPMQEKQIEQVVVDIFHACQACVLPSHAQTYGGEIYPIGAYQLGVMLPGETVDMVYIAPCHIQMPSFLNTLQTYLARLPGVSCLHLEGPDGHLTAPGFRLTLRGTTVKLLVSKRIPGIPAPTAGAIVPHTAGLIAWEVGDTLLNRVPNVELFRAFLKFVRYWAKRRGIYGSHTGFLSGTAWAICCARICQTYPHLEISQLAIRFFRTLASWDLKQPISLLASGSAGQSAATAVGPATDGAAPKAFGFELGQGSNSIVVLLPVGVGIPATPHVSETTAKIIQKQARRSNKMAQQVVSGKAQWADIYSAARFFERYRHYLEFDFMASSPEVLSEWLVWGKQQLQELVHLFEATRKSMVTLRPWPEFIEFKDAEWPHSVAIFVGLQLERDHEGARNSFDFREPIVKFLEAISTWPEATKHLNKFELLIRHVRLAELQERLQNAPESVSCQDAIADMNASNPPIVDTDTPTQPLVELMSLQGVQSLSL